MSARDLRRAYNPNYFCISDIMATQTLVPCQTLTRLPKFGFLVPDCNSEDLLFGTNVQLPLWAARVLCRPGQTFVSVNIPSGFKEAHKAVIEDDAKSTDLRKIHRHYFEAGHHCTSLFHNEAGQLAEMLPEILQQRFLIIGEATVVNPRKPAQSQVKAMNEITGNNMDDLETSMFQAARNAALSLVEWMDIMLPAEYEDHNDINRLHMASSQSSQYSVSASDSEPLVPQLQEEPQSQGSSFESTSPTRAHVMPPVFNSPQQQFQPEVPSPAYSPVSMRSVQMPQTHGNMYPQGPYQQM